MMSQSSMNEKDVAFYSMSLCFMILWSLILHMKEGARADESTFRLHLWHAIVNSLLVYSYFYYPGKYPEYLILASSITYYIVDVMKMLFNDFIYKVGGYQKGAARLLEYFHHFLSIAAISGCTFSLYSVCDVQSLSEGWQIPGPLNPLIRFSIADLSTVPLMLWRRSGQKSNFMYTCFAMLFFWTRILYHGFDFIPKMYSSCNATVKYGVVAYQAVQFVSFYFVLKKWYSLLSGKGSSGKSRSREAGAGGAEAETDDSEDQNKKDK